MNRSIKIAAVCLIMAAPAQAQILGKLKNIAGKVDNAVKKTAGNVDKVTGTSVSSQIPGSDNNSYFSDNSITFSKTRNGAAEKNFTVNDNLYATVKLRKPLIDFLKSEGIENEPFYRMPVSLIYIKDNAARGEYTTVKIPKSDYGKTTLVLDILPAKGDAKSEYISGGQLKSAIARTLSSFDASSYTENEYGNRPFHFTFGQNDEYHGAFNFSVTNKAEQKIIAQRATQGQDAMGEVIASSTTLPPEFSRAGKFADPQLSMANIRKMLGGGGVTLLKVVVEDISGGDYNIKKNALDIPEYKITAKPVWVAYKDTDGKCYFTRNYFTRNYEGGGKYGPLDVAATTASQTQIACENIK